MLHKDKRNIINDSKKKNISQRLKFSQKKTLNLQNKTKIQIQYEQTNN